MSVAKHFLLLRLLGHLLLWGAALVLLIALWRPGASVVVLLEGWGRGALSGPVQGFLVFVFPIGLLLGWLSGRWLGRVPMRPLAVGMLLVIGLVFWDQLNHFVGWRWVLSRFLRYGLWTMYEFMAPAAVLALGNWTGGAAWRSRPKAWGYGAVPGAVAGGRFYAGGAPSRSPGRDERRGAGRLYPNTAW